MLLNSYYFIAFFSIVFILYWFFLKTKTVQNGLLLLASYVFYASWSFNFLFLLIATTVIVYFVGERMKTAQEKKKVWWLRAGILVTISQLIYFKYSNFFIENFNDFLINFGVKSNLQLLKLVFPIGISFYSFRMMGYLLDIKNKKLKTEASLLDFSVFVAFFPCIIAGPIDKSTPFIKQLHVKREFSSEQFTDGWRQILWGLFKKLVVADNIATITGPMFADYQNVNGSALFVGAVLYFIQIYSDFSGYSDMAIGISKLLGIKVQPNFNFPLFAQNVADYWRRWHISLTGWLTEYVFTPLSIRFRDYGKWGLIIAIIVNFLVVGFWHGAEWHYIFHGLVSGLMFIPMILNGTMNKKVKPSNKIIPPIKELWKIGFTFICFTLLMILFSVKDMEMAFTTYKKIFSLSFFQLPNFKLQKEVFLLILLMMLIEWIGRDKEFAIKDTFSAKPRILRWGFYYVLVFLIFLFYIAPKGFIYAQF